jgi:hypothetical protein
MLKVLKSLNPSKQGCLSSGQSKNKKANSLLQLLAQLRHQIFTTSYLSSLDNEYGYAEGSAPLALFGAADILKSNTAPFCNPLWLIQFLE